jgi:cell division protein FtsW
VIYFAAWLSMVKDKVKDIRYGLLPFAVITGVTGIIMLLQPDTDTFLIMILAGIAMLVVSGVRVRDLFIMFLVGVLAFGGLITVRPYLRDRVMTFFDVNKSNALGSGYQVRQSLIAIGSGGAFGRGFGQSVQKYKFLPEPIGDSIFAVFGEEFGFVGSVLLILLFVAFTLQGFRIAAHAPDLFSCYLVVGLMVLIISQSFINIASMLSLFPLSGTPLVFVSQGGTSLLLSLLMVGIVLNISKYQKA